ncbi:SDR family NAD(P)-dependent oxidoreductase [Rhizobium sp. WYJ-E13]|uniref:SDR family NAD(P)-dependent oxidoreductase n=1 Tax=Rhizobium sp. WYJ-E13 TaxID=2849093 RepID=UPI001C1EEAE1|nr:SDR family oxidoreductase [Rhizobium sp. WYJ-E13]QWW72531.1 SDR family oxidoreductase [Rhizobium sp. WYJ-E13]
MSDVELDGIDFERLGATRGSRLLIVGGHGGIGHALALRSIEAGMEVITLDMAEAIEQNPLPDIAVSIALNVLDPKQVADAVTEVRSKWGKTVNGLIYLSGVGERPTPVSEFGIEQWDLAQDVNLRGAFVVSKAFLPLMRPGSASMVFISSGLAVNVEPGFGAYSASKAGLIAYAKVLAKELAPGIRVNVVAPGLVQTAFLGGGTGRAAAGKATLEQWFGDDGAKAMRAAIPLGRVAVPDDIVAPILFLLGSGARFITGQTLHVNGGRYLP